MKRNSVSRQKGDLSGVTGGAKTTANIGNTANEGDGNVTIGGDNSGDINTGTINNGPVNNGTVNNGTVNDGKFVNGTINGDVKFS